MTDPIDIARQLIRHGIPVWVARRAIKPDGSWDYEGEFVQDEDKGRFVSGYLIPGWKDKPANEGKFDDQLRRAQRFGTPALFMVTGHGLDLVDIDVHKGGAESLVGLYEADMMPTAFAVAHTPSGGEHYFVRSLGVRSLDGAFEGIDIKAGVGGVGHGIAFIAPTVKFGKDAEGVDDQYRGVASAYTWEMEPDFDALAEASDDDGEALAAYVTAIRSTDKNVVEDGGGAGKEYDKYSEAEKKRIDGYVERTLAGMESDLLAAHSWPERRKGERKTRSNSWEELCFYTFRRAARLAKAQWNTLTMDEARERIYGASPKWFDTERKWAQQERYAPPAELPFDISVDRKPPSTVPDDDLTLTDDSGAPIVGAKPVAKKQNSELDDFAKQIRFENRLTDVYLAEHVIEKMMDGRFVYTGEYHWMQFTGTHWEPVNDGVVLTAVAKELKAYHEREMRSLKRNKTMSADDKTKVKKALSVLLRMYTATAVMRYARGHLTISLSMLDAHPELLNCANGVIDLRTGELMPHDPKLYMTKVAPTNYFSDAKHDDWDKALSAIPEELQEWLQVRYGQAITGYATPDDLMLVQVGGGANGKSTVMQSIRKALGEGYAVLVPHRVLLASPSDHPTELMVLRGARFAVMEETPEARYLNATRLKAVLGSTMTARLIRKDEVQWEPTHSLFINTNFVPLVAETDDGSWRRLALVRFPFRYRKNGDRMETELDRPGDDGLRERMRMGNDGQHEAVLAWLVEGAVKWFAAGAAEMPTVPDRVKADTFAWRYEGDPMTEFIENYLELGDDNSWVPSQVLYWSYKDYLEKRGYSVPNEKTFVSRFSTHFMVTDVNDRVAKERGSVAAEPIRKARLYTTAPGLSVPNLFGDINRMPKQVMAWRGVKFSDQATIGSTTFVP